MKVKSLYGILFIVLCTLGIFCVDAQQAVTMRRASFDTLSTNRAQVLDTVVVKDKATGETIADADWITAEYDGAYIINLCSYTWDDREIEIYVNGNKVTASEDLINFGKYGETVTMEGHVPLLLKIEK